MNSGSRIHHRILCWAVIFVVLPVLNARLEAIQHPPTLSLESAPALPVAGEATRVHLLGLVEFYSLAVYVNGALNDRRNLASADVPKALRIEIRYQEDLRRRIALDWRRELVPQLESAAATLLRGAFAALKNGDVIVVEYSVGKGTTVRLNNRVAVSEANHDLMMAFLDHWLGQRPVSDEMKRTLIGSS